MKLPIAHGANGFATGHAEEEPKEIVQPDRTPARDRSHLLKRLQLISLIGSLKRLLAA
jgi:hypothetical protein